MKNEIKKIILTMNDEKSLKGLVVVRENSVEKIGYGKISNEELLKKYSKLVSELKEEYKDELDGLDSRQSVNKLYNLGKLEYSDKKIITKITNYLDESENPIKFVVTSTDGEEEIKLSDCYDDKDYILKFKDKMVEMCNTYNIELDSQDDVTDEFIENLEKMGLLENKQEEKIIRETLPETGEKSTELNKEVLTDAKIKNFFVNHKLLAGLITAGVVGLILSTHGCHKKEDTKTIINDTPNDNYEEETVEWNVVEDTLPTVEPIEYFKEIAFPNMVDYVDTVSDNVIVETLDGSTYNADDYYYGDKDTLIEIRNTNMSNVANYVQSDIAIKDQGSYIYHENLFNDNLKDKAYVKYFSMIGNQIIRSAYQDNYFRGILDNSVKSDEEVVRLINNDEPLEVCICGQMEYIRYSELSKSAKEMVLNIAWTNNLPLSRTILPSGYTQDDISEIILDKSNDLGIIK